MLAVIWHEWLTLSPFEVTLIAVLIVGHVVRERWHRTQKEPRKKD